MPNESKFNDRLIRFPELEKIFGVCKRTVRRRAEMELARHSDSDMRLTMKTYTDAGQLPLREVIDTLPGVGGRNDSRIDSRTLGATGQTVSPTVPDIGEVKTQNSLANTGESHRDSSLVTTSHEKSEWRCLLTKVRTFFEENPGV